MSIGAVLALLRDDFPEVTISKIRFLEAEGLVEPQRTPSGYRNSVPAMSSGWRTCCAMQRDHYLPLRVIREHLDALDRGEAAPALPAPRGPPGPLEEAAAAVAACAGRPTGLRLGREELLAATEAERASSAVGVLRPGRGRPGRRLRRRDAAGPG